jgi:hypothetical protein
MARFLYIRNYVFAKHHFFLTDVLQKSAEMPGVIGRNFLLQHLTGSISRFLLFFHTDVKKERKEICLGQQCHEMNLTSPPYSQLTHRLAPPISSPRIGSVTLRWTQSTSVTNHSANITLKMSSVNQYRSPRWPSAHNCLWQKFPVKSISIYTAKNCGEQTLALYRGLDKYFLLCRYRLEDLGVDGKIILKWIFTK